MRENKKSGTSCDVPLKQGEAGGLELIAQIAFQTHVVDLGALFLGPIDVAFFHEQNFVQQFGRRMIVCPSCAALIPVL